MLTPILKNQQLEFKNQFKSQTSFINSVVNSQSLCWITVRRMISGWNVLVRWSAWCSSDLHRNKSRGFPVVSASTIK